MRDAEIVDAMLAGEPHGLAEAYRYYADRLHDYCLRLLDDYEAAADAVHDTFIIAGERVGRLRNPDALRPWLYAIARSQCHRVLRRRSRFAASLEEIPEMTDESQETPERGLHREEVRTLVRAAMAGLNPREREVIDLTLRHELSGTELAGVLGVPAKQANAVAATARAQLERALGTLLVARTRGKDCPELRTLLADWDGEFTPLWRKRINRHLKSCRRCEEQRGALLTPASLLNALPLVAAPPELYEQLMSSTSDTGLAGHNSEFAEKAGTYDRDGFPVQAGLGGGGSYSTIAMFVTVGGLLLMLIGGLLLLPGLWRSYVAPLDPIAAPSVSSAGEPAPSPAGASESSTVAGASAAETSAPSTPARENTPGSPPGGQVAAPEEPPSPTSEEPLDDGVSGSVSESATVEAPVSVLGATAEDVSQGCGGPWTMSVSAQTSMGATSVVVNWESASASGQQPMSTGAEPGVWSATVGGLPFGESVRWWVSASGPGGTDTGTQQKLSQLPCVY
ncbi:sigma-70 family RNA polymerase sigma factor [Salinactinospora qingdaonensis]|uniref:RNA polymerase sigma-70 region 2 domain-containing protein n=1 Tax=Salinactinospora qingdaonensis TaxID=702744 RepID=A0ABP7EWT9_9ACTN